MTSLGEQLRTARRAKNKSLEDISRETNITKQYLKALEENNYDILPSPAYVKGFLSSYAKCVGLEPEYVVDQYKKLTKFNEMLNTSEDGSNRKSKNQRLSKRRVFWLFFAFFATIVCLVAILWLRRA